jgi:hypothetical protein
VSTDICLLRAIDWGRLPEQRRMIAASPDESTL